MGFSICSGNVVIASTCICTSSSISDKDSPDLSSKETTPKPSLAVDLISFIPSISSIASSIFKITPSSTSSGAAPKCATLIWIIFGLKSGNIFLSMVW